MSPEEARRLAYVKLGNPLRIHDRVWEANRLGWIEDIWRDLRYAARMLRKTPSFTCVALLVMALGIGANTAIYSFLDSLLLSSLPVSDPSSLVVINWHGKSMGPGEDYVVHSMSGNIYDDPDGEMGPIFPYAALSIFQDSGAVFSDVFAYAHTREVRSMNVSINGKAEAVSGELVSGDFFRGLGVAPAAGRLILSDDDRVGADPVVVVSFAFSEKHFGGAANASGKAISINGVPFTVAGVAPPEFFGVDPSQAPAMYVPMHLNLVLGTNDPFPFHRERLFGRELLLDAGDGSPAPGSDSRTSAGSARSEVSSMGCRHSGERQGARQPARACLARRQRWDRYAAAGVLQTFIPVDDAGRVDSGDRVLQCREPAAGARRFAPARDCGAPQRGREPRASHPPVAHGECSAGCNRRGAGRPAGLLGNSPVDGADRRPFRRCHAPSASQLACAGAGGGALFAHRPGLRSDSGAAIDARWIWFRH